MQIEDEKVAYRFWDQKVKSQGQNDVPPVGLSLYIWGYNIKKEAVYYMYIQEWPKVLNEDKIILVSFILGDVSRHDHQWEAECRPLHLPTHGQNRAQSPVHDGQEGG